MNTTYFLLLLAFTLCWVSLPLLPVLRETLRPSDTEPLRVVSRDTADIAFFAKNFRAYLANQSKGLQVPDQLPFIHADAFPDGTPVIVASGEPDFPAQKCDAVVIAETDTVLPAGMAFMRELYAKGTVSGGPETVFRAVLAEGALSLKPSSIVIRWAHSVDEFSVAEDSTLHGRASSDTALRLAHDVSFEWISAPLITIGPAVDSHAAPDSSTCTPFRVSHMQLLADDTYRYEESLHVPKHSLVSNNLIAHGNIIIGANSIVRGSLKSYGTVTIGDNCTIEGSIVSHRSIIVGTNAYATGPLIAEKEVTIGSSATIGRSGTLTTISAPNVELLQGATIHGMVIAQHAGKTGPIV